MRWGLRTTVTICVAAINLLLALLSPTKLLAVDSSSTDSALPTQIAYVFPFSKIAVTYPSDHIDYPAADVVGCFAHVLAPTAGTITQTRTIDKWTKVSDTPGTRGGKTITLIGDDNVRYYFAHLGRVKVATGQRVSAGDWIGVMGSSGNARITRCHTHFGISRVCPVVEAYLLQGEIWPQRFLNAWRAGEQLSPANAATRLLKQDPLGCIRSRADTQAALAQKTG
jgi:murein DD-endopeptidase MepM/ murein hydrolase activator NlpD